MPEQASRSPKFQAAAACTRSWSLLFSGVRFVIMYGSNATMQVPKRGYPRPTILVGHTLAIDRGYRTMSQRSPPDDLIVPHSTWLIFSPPGEAYNDDDVVVTSPTESTTKIPSHVALGLAISHASPI